MKITTIQNILALDGVEVIKNGEKLIDINLSNYPTQDIKLQALEANMVIFKDGVLDFLELGDNTFVNPIYDVINNIFIIFEKPLEKIPIEHLNPKNN